MILKLPNLKYSFSDLEPIIDAQTMEIHYSKHHQTYLSNFQKALENDTKLYDKSIDEILTNLKMIPEEIRTQVINHGGGFYNHCVYWESMSAIKDQVPSSKFTEIINRDFESLDKLNELFNNTAMSRFGSGWAWLVKDKDNKLSVLSTANQDTPLSQGFKPIFCIDVWEHAYYLKYQNKRSEYVQNWWSLIDWVAAEQKYNS